MVAGNVPSRGRMVAELEGVYDVFPLRTDQMTLLSIFGDGYDELEHIHIGSLIHGAVWAIRPPLTGNIGV